MISNLRLISAKTIGSGWYNVNLEQRSATLTIISLVPARDKSTAGEMAGSAGYPNH